MESVAPNGCWQFDGNYQKQMADEKPPLDKFI